jgi:hypothetical protein
MKGIVALAHRGEVGDGRRPALRERRDMMKFELIRRATPAAVAADERAPASVPAPNLFAGVDRDVAARVSP